MQKQSLLFLSPHPDDIFISCGGLILKSLNDYDIHVICFATKNLSPSNEIRLLEEKDAWNSVSSLQNLDINLSLFENGIDTKLHENYCEIVKFIESKVLEIKNVEKIFVPFSLDTHQDHRTVSQASLSACRYSRNIIFYETPSTIDFVPSMFVELPEDIMRLKMQISKKYASQILGTDSYSVDLQTLIESKAISNGIKTRTCKYAEGFHPFKVFL
jgi:LmbE family N-acetylglucosaminyl deacetylase